MAISTQITETNPHLDWFAEPLAELVNLFAIHLPTASGDDQGDSDPASGDSSDRLPPPTNESPSGPDPIPGEPVDTSQFRPVQSPAASTGTDPTSE
ncbi:hypothetical protein MOQ72_16145 [Saccharopolyspora sp. K220]|uniref:hypothetical protein n=1 Tax=Saccharopolyspora soli TaxID=2926618 RepID=UPI001F59B3D0|nr:hypothetical protein [Saccharopolyspora soli]MCI2418976.1 hypothetical protein [Saccharopolyspora soli]